MAGGLDGYRKFPRRTLPKLAQQPPSCLRAGKTYFGGGEWYTLDLDYARIASMLKEVGFGGYVSLEFEGKAPAEEGVRKSVEWLRSHLS